MSKKELKITKTQIDTVFLFCFIAGLCFLLWRVPFGFADSDEAFYLTIPYRLAMGDALLTQEWHVTQLSGFLLLPAMKLALAIRGGSDGILLCFRYICVAAQGLFSLYLYIRLRRESAVGAAAAALALLLYIPFNICALSYNSMGLFLALSSCVTAATMRPECRFDMPFAGLMFAGAVLCCPYLMLLYIIYSVCVFIRAVLVKKGRSARPAGQIYSLRAWLLFSLGAAALALIFGVFVLSRSEPHSIVNSILVIFEDPEHTAIPLGRKLLTYFIVLLEIHDFAGLIMALSAALLAVVLLDKKHRAQRKGMYAFLAALLTAAYAAPFLFEGLSPIYNYPRYAVSQSVNFLMLPLNLLGLFAYLLGEQRKKLLFQAVYIPGLVYGYCINLASNQMVYNITSVSAVSLVASLIFIVELAIELWNAESADNRPVCRILPLLLGCFIIAQLVFQISFRARQVYREDEPISALTHTIDCGPEKGLRTTTEKAKSLYYDIYEDTAAIRQQTEGKVVYFSERTWLYLADEKESAAYSAWLSFVLPDYSVKRLLVYWIMEPEKQADYIYVSRDFESAESYANVFNLQGAPIQETPTGYIIMP